ncbi:MAG: helix-turn-helix domain-containing protein [Polyangiaceae bacterium]|nr:helix-turn-helix domain-containing protein [Polyangiaceae bacterium]
MDLFTIPFRHHPRRLPARLPLAQLGYLPKKFDQVNRGFDTVNYSFILRGTGHYELYGVRHLVQAPCVFIEFPGLEFNYGPLANTSWEELYLMYDGAQQPVLEQAGLFDASEPIWSLGETRRLAALSLELRTLCTASLTHNMDRIDRVAEALLVEAHLAEGHAESSAPAARVREVLQLIEQRYLEDHDFLELARSHQLSPTHFRRLWNHLVGVPPARYVSELRLKQACRMLVESTAPVAKIAREMRFPDALYFSRKFRNFTGQNPTSYRRRYSGGGG